MSPTVRNGMAVVLALLLVGSAAAIVFLLDRRAEVETTLDGRQDVVRVAERFTVQFNTYQHETIDGYADSLRPLLSTSATTAFENQLEDSTRLIRETELQSEGEVLASGVASLDQDSASVLVVADAKTQSLAGPAKRHFRWEIDLVKVDGEWLVDDFTAVA